MTPEERARACCDTRDAEEVESRMVPADPGPAAALDLCERCGREPVSRHFDGTRGPRGGWWLCADCHATATMEE